jgi:hypothetical protein
VVPVRGSSLNSRHNAWLTQLIAAHALGANALYYSKARQNKDCVAPSFYSPRMPCPVVQEPSSPMCTRLSQPLSTAALLAIIST